MKRKIKKSVAKRFKVTKKGKVLRGHQYTGHLMRKKSKRRQRMQAEVNQQAGKFAKKIKQMLGEA